MIRAIADTHAIIWYLSDDERLSQTAKQFFEDVARDGHEIGISAVTLVEMIYLSEKSRIPSNSIAQLMDLLDDSGSFLVVVSLTFDIAKAMMDVSRDAVPDMPDRIITATASFLHVPVISRDAKIVASGITTIW